MRNTVTLFVVALAFFAYVAGMGCAGSQESSEQGTKEPQQVEGKPAQKTQEISKVETAETPPSPEADEGEKKVEETKKEATEEAGGPVIDDKALPQVTIQTSKGDIVIEMFEDDAPNTVANFINLAEKGFYNGLVFHRVIANFMIQGGDPQGTGRGGPGYRFADEFSQRKHKRGTLSMANSGPGTNGSQFFITHVPTPHLDGKEVDGVMRGHTVFGQVLKGQSVVDSIAIGDKMIEVRVDRKRSHAYAPKVI
jgi:peptidyl-prolyl cis-trans isomerase B (cyclophilin B)